MSKSILNNLRTGTESEEVPVPKSDASKKKGEKAKTPITRTARFKFEKETKGSFQYKEVNSNGSPVDFHEALAGAMYLRKSAFKDGKMPKSFTVELTID